MSWRLHTEKQSLMRFKSSWPCREDIFSAKDVFKYNYLLIRLFRKAIGIICKREMKLLTWYLMQLCIRYITQVSIIYAEEYVYIWMNCIRNFTWWYTNSTIFQKPISRTFPGLGLKFPGHKIYDNPFFPQDLNVYSPYCLPYISLEFNIFAELSWTRSHVIYKYM